MSAKGKKSNLIIISVNLKIKEEKKNKRKMKFLIGGRIEF